MSLVRPMMPILPIAAKTLSKFLIACLLIDEKSDARHRADDFRNDQGKSRPN